jgi:transposase-like protein
VKRTVAKSIGNCKTRPEAAWELEAVDAKVALIQALIPLGLQAVQETLEAEVTALAGTRYQRAGRQPGHVRWSQQQGSVYLGDQKLPVRFPRVRNMHTNAEVPLATYEKLQRPRDLDDGLLRRVLVGLSCGRYRECAQTVPDAFGLARATVSRRFIRASARQLQTLLERDLTGHDLVAVFLDGKSVAGDALVIAVGVTLQGEKVFLGVVQTATENTRVLTEFLQGLVRRGLRPEAGLLWLVDGGKGLRSAIRAVAGPDAGVQRCQWHKRENVVSYLPKRRQAAVRTQLQTAYQQPTYDGAKTQLDTLGRALARENPSAAASLREGLEETLTLHRLELATVLSRSFATTNVLESINAQVERAIRRVTRWQSGEQKLRWVASALLDLEPRLRRVKGYRALPQLRAALLRRAASATEATVQAA